jgi:F-type H+-transporting ATPase subunit epsilon
MPLTVEIVTIERVVRVEENVEVLVAPGSEGQLAILPRHAALMTTLDFGELIFRRGTQEESFAIAGGFMEVRNDRVSILADQAESAEEIDLDRARAARARAEERLRELQRGGSSSDADLARVQASLQKSLLRLRVAERRRRAPGAPRPGG